MLPVDSVRQVCDGIVRRFHPSQVILFSLKKSPSGEAKSFKVCVVARTGDKTETEKNIYLNIDSEIPYDVLVYTPSEWETLKEQDGSFANRILQEGTVVYGAGPSQKEF